MTYPTKNYAKAFRGESRPSHKLQWCPNCKEHSVATRIYQKVKRVQYCINRGCKYLIVLPDLKPEEKIQ